MNESWIVPCNVKRFDIITFFERHSKVVWRNSFTIHAGDCVYIYLGTPYGEIRYRCVALDETVSDEVLQANQYAVVRASSNNFYSQKVKYMVLKLEKVYPSGILSLQKLKTHGLGQVQIQARTGRQLQKYIDEVCAMFEEGEQANAES